MKILYVITGLAQGGAERVVCDLADSMVNKGHEVKIAYLTGDVLTLPESDSIELIKINLNKAKHLPGAYFRLAKLIKHYKPDIVHSHMVHANILSRLIRLTTPISKLISTAHNSNEGGFARMMAYRGTHNLANVTTNVSHTAVENFEKRKAVPKDGMITVYNGVNFDRFKYNSLARKNIFKELNLDSACSLILAVGRFNQQKNYPNLLRAIHYLKKNYEKPFMLLIAGDGELRNDIEKIIKDFNLKDNVVLLGRRSDVNDLMSACDVFVLSSDYEGLPTVLIEAMGCQANIVSTEVSGAKEIISSYGSIVPTRDPILLYKAILNGLNKNKKNKEGEIFVKEKFSLDIISQLWLEIYNER